MQPLPKPDRGNRLGDIDLCYVAVMAKAINALGHDPEPLLTRYGITETLLATPDVRISIPRFMRLGHAAIRLTGAPALGLTMGSLTRTVDLGLAGQMAQTAATPVKALELLIRFEHLTSQNSRGHSRFERVAGDTRAHFYSIRPYNAYNRFVVDAILAGWTQFLRTLTERQEVLREVHIEYADQGLREQFEAYFRCPVRFGSGQNTLILARELDGLPCAERQAALHAKLLHHCQVELDRIHSASGPAERVKEVIAPLLQGEAPSATVVAKALGTTPWTLRRRLAPVGQSFQSLLDETRRELALDYVRDTPQSFAEIAWLLGFSGPPAFHRAFQRWFGISPGEFRTQLRIQRNQQTASESRERK